MEKLISCPSSAPKRKDAFCCVCEGAISSPVYQYLRDESSCDIRRCRSCGHLFMYPVALPDLNSRSMQSVDDAELFGSAILRFLYEKLIITEEIRAVRKYIKNERPRVLDIGCGSGWIASIWKKHGFHVLGLEPSHERRKVCREKYGIETVADYAEHFKTQEKFDVILMRHLLEHIEKPSEILDKICSLLDTENGILLIVVPNINSIGRFIFRHNWEWILPWHIHFFTPKTLVRFIENKGFKTLKLYQQPSPLWYTSSLKRCLGEKSRMARWINKVPKVIMLTVFLPVIFWGIVFRLDDNLTLLARARTDKI